MAGLDDDRVALMRAFVECGRRLNFNAAAKALGLTPSTLGRRVARLEARLGVALFVRTTRRVTLTEAGAVYLPLCEEILSDLDEADATASSLGGRPTGFLRVSAPTALARLHLTPAIPRFLATYPEVRLDLRYSDNYVDLVEERIDVAVRIGRLADSSLRARSLGTNRRSLVAAPAYLARSAPLGAPDDLALHRLLHYSPLRSGDTWTVLRDGAEESVPIRPWLRSNDAFVLLEAAIAGEGVALLADYVAADALRLGAIVRVMEGWPLAETGIHAVWPGSVAPPKTRAFVSFLVELMASVLP